MSGTEETIQGVTSSVEPPGGQDQSAPESTAHDTRLPVIRAFTAFSNSMSAIFDLINHHHEHSSTLDSRIDNFMVRVRQWNPVDSDEAIRAIFSAADRARQDNEDPANVFDEISDAATLAIAELSMNPDAYLAQYFSDLVSAMQRRSRTALMRESLLTSAVGAFEALMTEIMLGYAQAKPESMFESDRRYKLHEVASFPSIKDLLRDHAEKFVRAKVYENVGDWFAWLGKCVDLPISNITVIEHEFLEIFLRRNNLVHAAGLVNQIYLGKLPSEMNQPKLNSRLLVSSKYLNTAYNRLLAAGYAAYAHFVSFYEDEADGIEVTGLIATYSFRLLLGETFEAATDYCKCVRHLCAGDASAEQVLTVNDWIARKALGRTDEVRAEVEAWNVAGQPRRFSLARLALLDDVEGAFRLADEMLSKGDLQPVDWFQWPLLTEVRRYAEEVLGGYTPPVPTDQV